MLAERKAWELAKKHDLQLTVINPGLVLGALVIPRFTPCMHLITILAQSPVYLNQAFCVVAAEDVALAHLRAWERPEKSVGERFILNENTYRMKDIIAMMKETLTGYSYRFGYVSIPERF